jgi:phage tail-like protein
MVSGRGTTDPPFVGLFTLEVGGTDIGRFTEVAGLSVQLDVEEVAEGGQNAYTHRLLGRMKWPNLVFKRGLTDTDALFEWLMSCSGEGLTKEKNRITPRDAKVSVLTAKGRETRVWTISGARPVKWTGPKLAASSRELAVEELEVVHHGFRAQKKV